MPQKLAIAISGAVSLGSYESGVVYEIVEAIAQHNQSPKTNPEGKIEIDVITGASAGAMTACILAQKLLFEAENLRSPYDNHLYQPWVKDVDIRKLLQIRPEDNPNQAILSSAFIEEIGNRYLLQRYATGSPSDRHRHPAAAASILLGIAMSNLNGYDYKAKLSDFNHPASTLTSQGEYFTYTCHEDRYTTQIQGTAADDQRELWNFIKNVGISSGAFPFAFEVQGIVRQTQDVAYEDSEIYNTGLEKFAYTDGGIFNNEPLGMAKKLVNQIDTNPRDYESRFYLYVSPSPKSSKVNKEFKADKAIYLNTAKALTGAIFTQARFQEWITTSSINQAIHQFDAEAISLKNFFLNCSENGSQFDLVFDKLLQALYSETGDLETQQKDRERLKIQFREEYQELVNTGENATELADTWLKTVQVLEKAAGLSSKDVMVIYAITANDGELAGEKLSAFAGFFDQSFREYDYFIGRQKAVQFLQQLQVENRQGKKANQLYLTNFQAGNNLRQPTINLGDVELDKVDESLRQKVKTLLLERAGRIIQSLEKRPLVTCLLKFSTKRFLAKQLNRILKLE